MKLVPEVRQASKLWSIRLAAVSAALAAAEASLPLWGDILPNGIFAGLSSVVAIAAAVARVIRQESLHRD